MSKKVWANALLSDGKILFWWTGSECKTIYDFYKDFYYAHINLSNYEKNHKLELVKTMFEENSPEDNERIFDVLAKEFYRKYEISPDSKGTKPYERTDTDEKTVKKGGVEQQKGGCRTAKKNLKPFYKRV